MSGRAGIQLYSKTAWVGTCEVCFLRPADTRCRRASDEHLAGSAGDHVIHVLDAAPLGGHHEECCSVRPPEHAGVAGAIELDPLQHLAAFANPCAGVVSHWCPDCAFGVETDAVAVARP